MLFRLILSVDILSVAVLSVDAGARLFVLLAGLLVFVLSKLELKSAFLSLFCCGVLKLEGLSFMGLPSRKLFALEVQSCVAQSGQIAYAVDAKLAVTTMRDKVTRKILDLVIISLTFTFLLFMFDSCRTRPSRSSWSRTIKDWRISSRMVIS